MHSDPHDRLFKAVFAKPENARGALRSVLPAALVDALDWSTLAQCPGSFVDDKLRQRHTDLLFSSALRGGGEALIYVVFEHQSSQDRHMAFRLLRYMLRIWERWQTEHPNAPALPIIMPVVLYHGDAPWSVPRSFEAILDLPEPLAPQLQAYLPRFDYLVDDLSQTSDQQLRDRAMTAAATLATACFKYARSAPDLLERLHNWADLMREVVSAPNGLDALAQLLRYALMVNDHLEPEALYDFLEHNVGAQAKETAMTAGQRLIQQGKLEGIEQGIEKGIEKGERQLLRRLLERRFGDDVDADVQARIANATTEQLEAWADLVLSATTLADVFDG